MKHRIGVVLSLLLAALGMVSPPDAGALGLAIALVAVVALTVALALAPARPRGRSVPDPLRAISRSALPSQSHPDAAGHPRPRAPGAAVAA
ncbi:DUF6412 domain-containing protein [Microbacterium azadirachtae]|uniref:DUF6412 domain-containing protein n=1 Tax=Microbacterium azadirachtae TaxID=582680 RepID=UPI0021D4999A|nr:DUF6412 domain-containing protein [Microbacterium azadirachtae]UXW86614.1 DUF6412 domain-containing protein [Microbacterium azadirachtae]